MKLLAPDASPFIETVRVQSFADFTASQAALWAAITARRIAALGKCDDTYAALYRMTDVLTTALPSYEARRAVYDTQDALQCVAVLAMIAVFGPATA